MKTTLAQEVRFNIVNFLEKKRKNKTPFYHPEDGLIREIEKGIKEYIENEIKNAKFPKKSVYEISYLDVAHNQFKVKMFDNLPMAVEWMRYLESKRYSKFRYIACNFQDEYDASNEVPF